jgi:predicted nucleotidyltransferase
VQEIEDLLLVKKIGKSKTIMLNAHYPSIRSYLVVSSEEEEKEFLERHSIIKKIAKELETKNIVLLFGSYAKGTQRKDSDIDLLIISKDGKKEGSFSKYETLFRVKINPLYITVKEFKEMLKDSEENVGKQALKCHIILNNAEKFWECIFHG